VYGYVKNVQPTAFVTGTTVLTISNSLYYSRTSFSTGVFSSTGSGIVFDTDQIKVSTGIGSGETIYFDLTYLLND
jgi:hypothetical protein